MAAAAMRNVCLSRGRLAVTCRMPVRTFPGAASARSLSRRASGGGMSLSETTSPPTGAQPARRARRQQAASALMTRLEVKQVFSLRECRR